MAYCPIRYQENCLEMNSSDSSPGDPGTFEASPSLESYTHEKFFNGCSQNSIDMMGTSHGNVCIGTSSNDKSSCDTKSLLELPTCKGIALCSINSIPQSPFKQPTYLLLQSSTESNDNQLYLALRAPNATGDTDARSSFITLHPVSFGSVCPSNSSLVILQNESDANTNVVTSPLPVMDVTDLNNKVKPTEISCTTIGSCTTAPDVVLNSTNVEFIPDNTNLKYSLTSNHVYSNHASSSTTTISDSTVITEGSMTKLPPLTVTDQVVNIKMMDDGGILTDGGLHTVGSGGGSGQQETLSGGKRRFSHEPRTCNTCGRSFKYPSDLKKHEQIHTEIKKFVCIDCGRNFRRLHQLNVHRRIHTGEKPYVCTKCDMAFRHDSTLTMHTRTRHEHLRPFQCNVCNKLFGRLSHLRKHQRYVCATSRKQSPHQEGGGSISEIVEDPTFECRICGAGFCDDISYKNHEAICYHKERRHEFDPVSGLSSNYLFNDISIISKTAACKKERLDHHHKSCSSSNKLSCNFCGKSFSRSSGLQKHLHTHKNNYLDEASGQTSSEPVSALNDYGNVYQVVHMDGGSIESDITNLRFSSIMSNEQMSNLIGFGEPGDSYFGDIGITNTHHQHSLGGYDITSEFLQASTSSTNHHQVHHSCSPIETFMNDVSYIVSPTTYINQNPTNKEE